MKRILFVITGGWSEEVQNVIVYWRQRLDIMKERGRSFTFIAPSPEGRSGWGTVRGDPTFWVPMRNHPLSRFNYAFQVLLNGLKWRSKYDIIWSESPQYGGVSAGLLGRLLGKKTIIFSQGPVSTAGYALVYKRWWQRWFYKIFTKLHLFASFQLAKKIVPVNIKVCEAEALRAGAPKSRMRLLYNNIDPSLHHLPARKKISGKPLAIFVGRIVPFKGLDWTLQAWKYVEKEMPSAKLVVIGTGTDFEPMKRLAASLNLKHVEFTAKIPNEKVFEYQSKAWAFITTSPACNFSYSTMEAVLAGTPIVATDVGATREVLRPETDAFLAPLNDRKIADAIIQALSNPKEANRRAKSARENLNKFIFTSNEWCDRIEQIMNE
ncbi:MAG: glycosyltransferase family 4 protein [Candidatus Micrarchaeota archaeon]